MTRQAVLNVCTESEPFCVHFSKVNKLAYDITTLVVGSIKHKDHPLYTSKTTIPKISTRTFYTTRFASLKMSKKFASCKKLLLLFVLHTATQYSMCNICSCQKYQLMTLYVSLPVPDKRLLRLLLKWAAAVNRDTQHSTLLPVLLLESIKTYDSNLL